MGAADEPRRVYCRRITLQRPGEESVILVTSLTDAEQYPAEDLLELYLLRWDIENHHPHHTSSDRWVFVWVASYPISQGVVRIGLMATATSTIRFWSCSMRDQKNSAPPRAPGEPLR